MSRRQRNYRDPLHNIISLDEAERDDRLLVRLIDSAEFQRLRRVKQLGLALFTYQGAEHSRFTHSLGVMHLMTRALNLLARHHSVSEEARIVGRAGALLHDLGHGPFSHVMEKVFRFHHEDWSRRIVLDGQTEVNEMLREVSPDLPGRLAALYGHEYRPLFISQLVSSQLDCDRMDYLLRDSLMTGAKYGIYDLEWVLHTLRIDPIEERIYVEWKGLHAVEEYLQARYYMFRQVYFHRTLRSAEAVLVSALRRARELVSDDKLKFRMRGLVFEKMLMGQEVTTSEYLQFDDADVTFHMKQWMNESDPILSDLSSRFINRRLFKAIDLPPGMEESFWEEARSIVAAAGLDPEYYLMLDKAGDVPYYGYYSPHTTGPGGPIFMEVQGAPGSIQEISHVSEIIRAMASYQIERACFPVEVSDPMYELARRHATSRHSSSKGATRH